MPPFSAQVAEHSIGSLFALLFGIFFTGPDVARLVVYALVVGATFGALFGASVHYTRSGGRRDFASARDIEAGSLRRAG